MCDVLDVLMGDQCGSNMGGTKLKFHYAGHNDIATFGAKPTTITNPEDEYTITTPHIFKQGKCFRSVMITQDSGANTVGPGGANSGAKQNSFVFRLPSNNPQALVLFNAIANGIYPVLVLVEDANMPDGTYDQLGTNKIHATITAQKIPGTNNGDGSMYEFTVACTQPSRLWYKAAVTLTPAA